MEKNFLLKIFKVKDHIELSAKLISLILSPVVILIPLPFYLIYETKGEISEAIVWTLISFLFIFIYFIYIVVGVKLKIFSDFDISKRKQRPQLYFTAIFLVILYILVLFFLQAPKILFITTFSLALGLLILQIANNFLKASAHVATITAFVTAMVIIHKDVYYLLGYLFVFLVGWSRIKLRRHTVLEVLVGGMLGGLLSIIVYIITTRII